MHQPKGGHIMRRFIATAIISVLGAAMPAECAAAGEPPTSADATFTQTGLCTFPVLFELSGKAKTIMLPGGRTLMTSPGLHATLTNVDAPENTETFVITSAFHMSVLDNGDMVTVTTGRSLLFDPVAGFVLAIGRFSFVFDAQNNLVQPLSGEGQLIDVCELLS
jgi:hypothetical protein